SAVPGTLLHFLCPCWSSCRSCSRVSAPSFFFNATAPSEIYALSLHDALPISYGVQGAVKVIPLTDFPERFSAKRHYFLVKEICEDRKSTRLNSSHVKISYAVFCLKKKKKKHMAKHQTLVNAWSCTSDHHPSWT